MGYEVDVFKPTGETKVTRKEVQVDYTDLKPTFIHRRYSGSQ